MKLRYFTIIPLLLVGCTSNERNYARLKVYYDVHYYFNYGSHRYFVFSDSGYQNKVGECPIDKFYYIYNLTSDIPNIRNEYFVETQELFVYDHK